MGSHIPAHMPNTPAHTPPQTGAHGACCSPTPPAGAPPRWKAGGRRPALSGWSNLGRGERLPRGRGDVCTRELAMIGQVTDPRPDDGQRVLPGAGSLAGNAHRSASLVAAQEFEETGWFPIRN